MARPTTYTQEVGLGICERLVEGMSLRAICRAEDAPGISTVFQWLQKHTEFAEQYARAKEEQADTLADEIIDIADNDPDPNRARIRVDARKWAASKLKPRKYSDRQQVELGGANGGPVQFTAVVRKIVDPTNTGQP